MINDNLDDLHLPRDEYELIIYTRSDLIWGNNFWTYFDDGNIWKSSNNSSYKNTSKVWISRHENSDAMNDRFMIMTQDFFKAYSFNFNQKLTNYLNQSYLVHGEHIHKNNILDTTARTNGTLARVSVCYGVLRYQCQFTFYGRTDCDTLKVPRVDVQLHGFNNFSQYAICRSL
jgi:hypothetical protein